MAKRKRNRCQHAWQPAQAGEYVCSKCECLGVRKAYTRQEIAAALAANVRLSLPPVMRCSRAQIEQFAWRQRQRAQKMVEKIDAGLDERFFRTAQRRGLF